MKKYISFLLLTFFLFSFLNFPVVYAADYNFSEAFTATTYKDATNTTANWDTGNHKVILNANNSYTTTDQTQYPTASRIKGLSFIDSNNGWAVSEGGSVVATTNGGTSWSRVGTIGSSSSSDIQMIDASTGYISSGDCADCGGNGGIVKTTNGGATWTSLTLPAPVTQFKDNVLNLHFIDANTGWASRLSGQIIYTTNGGSSWTSQSVGATEHLSDVFFVNATTGWTVGYTGRIFKTTDSGSTWTEQTSGTSTQLRSVYFLNANNGWAVGQADAGGNVVALYTTNGGTSWTVVNLGEYGHDSANRVSFIDENNGYISGYAKTTNGGVTWTNIDKSPWLTNAFGLYVFDANTVIMGGDAGGIRKTTNAGTTWTYVLGPSAYTGRIVGLTMRTASLGYAILTYDTLKTTNGGTTWSAVNSQDFSTDMKDSIFVSDTVGIAVGSSGTIYKTTDSGVTWTQKSSGSTKNLSAVDFVDANNGIAVGAEGAVLVTSDGGETWTIKTSGTSSGLNDVSYGDSSTIYAAGGGSAIKSTNGGTTWNSLTISGFGVASPAMFFIDANTGWIVGTTTVYKTTDGGTSWTTQSTGISGSVLMTDMFFLNSSEGWVVGEGGTVLRTSNGGSSWTTYNLGTNLSLGGIDFPSGSTTGWIGGSDSTFAKLTAGSGTVYQSSNTIQSLSVDTTNDRIVSATLTATATLNGGAIAYYLSPDSGTHWESTTSGQSHTFTNMGTDLKWKAVLSTSNTSVTPEISNIAISYTDVPNAPANTAPTATTPAFSSQADDGTGYVTFSTQIDDPDDNYVKLKVEYSEDNGSTWKNPCLVSVTASSGGPSIQPCNGTTYTMTRHPYSYSGNNYTFLDEDPGEGPNNGVSMVYNSAGHPGSEDILNVTTNNGNITSAISSSPPTWNLGLIAVPGRNAYYTMYFKDSLFPNSTVADTWCDSFMGTSCTVNFWADDVFVYSNGAYVYTAPSGPTVLTTYQTGTPAINLSTTTNVPTGYQIGLPSLISTVSGGNTLTIVWNTKGVNGSSVITGEQNDIKVRVTPNDLMLDGTAQASSAFSIDNLAPSGGLTTFAKSAVTSSSVTLNWNVVTETNFDHYSIWYGTTSEIVTAQKGVGLLKWNDTNAANMAMITTTSAIITGLTGGTTYWFKIWAIDDYGNRLSCSEAQAITLTTPSEIIVTGGNTGGGSSGGSSEVVPTITPVSGPSESPSVVNELIQPLVESTIKKEPTAAVAVKLPSKAIESVISAYESKPEALQKEEISIESKEVLKTQEILKNVISAAPSAEGGSTGVSKEQIVEAQETLKNVVQESIAEALKTSVSPTGTAGGGSVQIQDVNGQMFEVKSLNDIQIEVVVGAVRDENFEKNLQEKKEDLMKQQGKKLLVLDERSDFDDDNVSDAYQVMNGWPLFSKGDAYTTAEKIYLGLDPNDKKAEVSSKPRVTNLDGKIVSGKDLVSFRIAGDPGDIIDVVLLPTKSRKQVFDFRTRALFASAILADVAESLDPNSDQIYVGKVQIDEKNKGELTFDSKLEDGEYYVFAEGKNGIGEASSFTVDRDKNVNITEFEVEEIKSGSGAVVTMLLELSKKTAPEFRDVVDNIISKTKGLMAEARQVVKGVTEPGSTVFVTWKSRILSSVVLADAKGAFQLNVPREIAKEFKTSKLEHEVLAYSLNERQNIVGGVKKFLLKK